MTPSSTMEIIPLPLRRQHKAHQSTCNGTVTLVLACSGRPVGFALLAEPRLNVVKCSLCYPEAGK
jgi:hypothetical protein